MDDSVVRVHDTDATSPRSRAMSDVRKTRSVGDQLTLTYHPPHGHSTLSTSPNGHMILRVDEDMGLSMYISMETFDNILKYMQEELER